MIEIGELLRSLLDFTTFQYLRTALGDPPWLGVVLNIVAALIIATIPLLMVFFVGWTERKVLARMQDRIGPNRVGGKYGQLQMVADVVKMMTKEMIVPAGADKIAYFAAPILALMTSVLLFAVLPFAPGVVGTDINVAAFYILSISSISVVSILLAGWGSNNKYALLGAFRAVAQLVSYEIPMILSLLVPLILAKSLSLVNLVEAQPTFLPFIFYAPLSALLFLISSLAETGRSPFDLLEAESEIIAGFHTEYTGMNFGLFMAAEYIAIMFMCAMFATAYLGGYKLFGLEDLVIGEIAIGRIIGIISLVAKSSIIFFIFMWARGTLPRFRIDQLLNFGWKFMTPLSILLIFSVVIIDKLIPASWGELVRAAIHLVSNLTIGYVTLTLLRRRAVREREAFEAQTAENQAIPAAAD